MIGQLRVMNKGKRSSSMSSVMTTTMTMAISMGAATVLLNASNVIAAENGVNNLVSSMPTAQRTTAGLGTASGGNRPVAIAATTPRAIHFLKPGDPGYSQAVANLPPDFPVPVFTGSQFVSATQVAADSGRQFYGRFHVNSDPSTVATWYQQSLANTGWTVTMNAAKDSTGAYSLAAYEQKPLKAGCAIRLETANMTDRNNRQIPGTNIGISCTIK